MFRFVSVFFVLLTVVVLGSAHKADAANKTWAGTLGTAWNAAGNWTGGLPVNGDNITIPGSLGNYPIISVASTFTVNDITIASGASLTVNSSGSVSGHNLTVTGSLTISAGTVTLSNDFSGAGTTTMSGGNLIVNHDWKPTATNFSASGGTVELNGADGAGGFGTNGATYNFFNLLLSSGTQTIHGNSSTKIAVANNLSFTGSGKLSMTSATNTANAIYEATVQKVAGAYTSTNDSTYFAGTGTMTVATPKPTVLSVTPADAATGVLRTADMVVTFDQSMNTSSVESAFSTSPTDTYTYVWSTTTLSNDTVTISHTSTFPGHTLYTATISTGATNSMGGAIAAPYSWSFTTRSSSSSSSTTSTVTNADCSTTTTVTTNGVVTSTVTVGGPCVTTTTTTTPAVPATPAVVCPAGTMFDTATGARCTEFSPAIPATPATPAAHGYAFGTILVKQGSKGGACKAWQMFLNDHGANLATDGACGKLTMAAARAWQASVGLKADGLLGAKSRAKAMMQ